MTGVVGGATVWVVIFVISDVVSVVVSSFRVVSGGTEGTNGGRDSISGLVVVDSSVVLETAGSRWHPGKVCRVVWE